MLLRHGGWIQHFEFQTRFHLFIYNLPNTCACGFEMIKLREFGLGKYLSDFGFRFLSFEDDLILKETDFFGLRTFFFKKKEFNFSNTKQTKKSFYEDFYVLSHTN